MAGDARVSSPCLHCKRPIPTAPKRGRLRTYCDDNCRSLAKYYRHKKAKGA